MKKIIILVLTIVLLASAAMLLKKRKAAVANAPTPTPLTYQVKVESAENTALEQTRPFLAHLSSRTTAMISSKLSGRVTELLVHENQPVKKGDLLLRIDDASTVAELKSLQATMIAQEKDVQYSRRLNQRNKALFEAGGLAREKFEASEVAYATKQATLEMTGQKIVGLEAQFSYLSLRAPFGGIVGTILVHSGDLATPGKPLLSVNSPDQKLTFSYVPDTITVETGQEVFMDGSKIGSVIRLYSDAANGLSVAEIGLDVPLGMPNNSYVNIDLLTFSGTGCRVPLDALLQRKEGGQLMSYADGKFSVFPVSVIASNEEYALVEPCPVTPVAVASDAKLSRLPALGQIKVHGSLSNE
jgi:multidrug efflux pump subunit AcrA (membrane-fusion protein)